MEAKQKAEEIIKKIFNEQHTDTGAKKIMLSTPKIAFLFVDEIITILERMNSGLRGITTTIGQTPYEQLEYWIDVKKEMEIFFKENIG